MGKGKKIGLIIAIIGLLLIIGASVHYFTTKKETPKEKKEEIVTNVNGIYELNGTVIKIYKLEDEEKPIEYNLTFNIDNQIFGSDKLENNKMYSIIFNTEINMTFEKDKLILKLDDETINKYNLKNGTYKKIRDFNIDDYYKDNYGDPDLLKTKYNGVFVNQDIKITMYQKAEDIVGIKLSGVNDSSIIINYYTYLLSEDGTLREDTLANEKATTTIKLDNDNIIFESTSQPDLSGTYVKKSDITIKDVIINN